MKAFFVAALLVLACLQSAAASDLVLIQFDTDNYDSTLAQLAQLEQHGVTPRHIIVPNCVIVDLHEVRLAAVAAVGAKIYTAESASPSREDPVIEAAYQAYRYIMDPPSLSSPTQDMPSIPDQPDYSAVSDADSLGQNAQRTDRRDRLTGQFMIGYVAVGIYLMESTGSTENWYPDAETRTFAQIVQGLDRMVDRASERGHKLVWVYPPVEKISTAIEPITANHYPGYELGVFTFGWLDNIYASHGLPSQWDGAYALANQLRHNYQTNWAVEFAVVMDDNDADHRFADGYFAYFSYPDVGSENRSPVVVMTYNNASYTPYGMHKVVAHEVSHVFGASDEYYNPSLLSPTCDDLSDCGIQSSYLQANNGNCEHCNANSDSCYMKRESQSICDYTPPELGWRDSDGDGASDAIDQNYTRFTWIHYLNPGDIIRIFNMNGQLVNAFSVTQDQLTNPYNAFFWNGVAYDNSLCATGIYAVTRNDSPIPQVSLSSWSASPPYVFTNHYFIRDTLRYKVPSQAMYIRNDIHDSQGNLMARPRFNNMTYQNVVIPADLSGWPDGVYTSQVSGWLPTGTNAQTSTLTFINYVCGDLDNDGTITSGDVTYLIATLFSGGPQPIHPSAGNVDHCTGDISVSDLTYLVAYVFQGGPAPACCHTLP